ncbi:MAG: transcription antitermination factor NusB [Flavobacteriales bacterium]|nr:transcription antitermination factor NusB [Flavobacteriales bacterium]MDP7430643.1 transcription antitermination factor NusB [Flavobacteriales bacterium]HJN63310.1 transcription antitermination factor NusB [Flavobacteriales bacterium]
MINRRHIRLKVMQSLYAYFTSKDQDLAKAQKKMLRQADSIIHLYFLLLSLPLALAQFSKEFLNKQKNKYFPTDADKNANGKFADNHIIRLIAEDEVLLSQINKVSGLWLNNDHDIIRKLFVKIWRSDLYKAYTISSQSSFKEDKEFLLSVFDNFIIDDELLHHILEEESIFWMDDLPFVANIVYSQIKATEIGVSRIIATAVFKNNDDKTFAEKLFNKTIINHKEFENIISKRAKNWDLDRIASMDQILIMMALCELIYFDEIPVKVTLNEYIEVAKYYSTINSKSFINGILDKVISEYTKSGKIKKVGRGLLE